MWNYGGPWPADRHRRRPRSVHDGRGERVDEFIVSVPFSSRRHASADAKRAPRGGTNVVLGPAFRLLAHLGVYERFINRQRRTHTFVTNLRGPQRTPADRRDTRASSPSR